MKLEKDAYERKPGVHAKGSNRTCLLLIGTMRPRR